MYLLARNSPKQISGASGGFLPRPLLLRLRHPNSKKRNQPKFCGILSPENCFRKTSFALFQISSLGFISKNIRTLSNEYRNFSKRISEPKIWPARSAVCSLFPPKNPESERVRHRERGKSWREFSPSVAPLARPHFWREFKFRFVAVFAGQSSNLF